jgi:hypothetical protein
MVIPECSHCSLKEKFETKECVLLACTQDLSLILANKIAKGNGKSVMYVVALCVMGSGQGYIKSHCTRRREPRVPQNVTITVCAKANKKNYL